MKVSFIILLFIVSTAWLNSLSGQGLRIDAQEFDRELSTKKTNGEILNFIQARTEKAKSEFGVESPEYIGLRTFYLDEHERIFSLAEHYSQELFEDQKASRKEMIGLVRKVFGDTSYLFSLAVIRYSLIQTNIWNEALIRSQVLELEDLFQTAKKGIRKSRSMDTKTILSYVCLLEERRANVYYKSGERETQKRILDSSIATRIKYTIFDNSFPTTIQWYASSILVENVHDRINFLNSYDSIILAQYAGNPKIIYQHEKNTLSHLLQGNILTTKTWERLNKADSLCKLIFGYGSHEHIYFLTHFTLQHCKKLGLKSLVYRWLREIQDEAMEKGSSGLTFYDGLYFDFCREWYDYFSSISDKKTGITYLKTAEKFVDSSLMDRAAFQSGGMILQLLSDYYVFQEFDSCLYYTMKLIKLDEAAKKKWGDYYIQSYGELAKKILYHADPELYPIGVKYADLCLKEMGAGYGVNSFSYEGALYTSGEYDFLLSDGKKGMEKMQRRVYSAAKDNRFIPPLNTSVFQSYAFKLSKTGNYDSSDYFFWEILRRNDFGSLNRVLGFDEISQLASLHDLANQKSLIFSDIFLRSHSGPFYDISIDLASLLFRKNQTFQLQQYLQASIEYGKKNQSEEYKWFAESGNNYDSLINSCSLTNLSSDTIYRNYDTYKNWLLEDYYYNALQNSQSKKPIKEEPLIDEIQAALKEGDLLLNIQEFRLNDRLLGFSPYPSYAILLLDKNSGKRVKCIILEDADSLVNYAKDQEYKKLSIYLKELVRAISPYKNIYVISDGVFSLINFNALTDEKGKYLIQTKNIHYISSGLKLLENNIDKEKGKTAYFFGAPDFMGVDTNEGRGPQEGFFTEQFVNLFGPLEHTKTEIQQSRETLNRKGWKTWMFTEKECSEKNFRNIRSADIIHVATHGFYMDEDLDWSESILESENPYLKNGVIFGAKPPAGAGLDNILTAFEVFRQDLRQVSLVVLSACQTAKGRINAGEGVFGLQKALRVAGVKNLILTTKNVDDKATRYLMVRFYTEIAKAVPYEEALRKAQLQMLEMAEFKQTDYWAPFLFIQN